MSQTKPEVYYAAMAATIVLVSTVLARFMVPWSAWFIGGSCGVIPLWFSLPSERRVWWKALLAAVGAGCTAATIIYLAG